MCWNGTSPPQKKGETTENNRVARRQLRTRKEKPPERRFLEKKKKQQEHGFVFFLLLLFLKNTHTNWIVFQQAQSRHVFHADQSAGPDSVSKLASKFAVVDIVQSIRHFFKK